MRNPEMSIFLLYVALLPVYFKVSQAKLTSLRLNVGGGDIGDNLFFADPEKHLQNRQNTAVVKLSSTIDYEGAWALVYSTYRYSFRGNLEYKIPIPKGKYKLLLLFAETWKGTQEEGKRIFHVAVNGQILFSHLDVYSKVGENKPLLLPFSDIEPIENYVTITLLRIPSLENPMISGIVFSGNNVDSFFNFKKDSIDNVPQPSIPSQSPVSTRLTDQNQVFCKKGIFGKGGNQQSACCPKNCKKCGGPGCGKFSPGTLCCVGMIYKIGKSCDTDPPPCVPKIRNTQLSCDYGIFGQNKRLGMSVCCPESCKKCGGKGCNKFSPGVRCCIRSIFNSNVFCNESKTPCIPIKHTEEDLPGVTEDATKSPPSDEPSPFPSSTLHPEDTVSPICPAIDDASSTFSMNVGGDEVLAARMGSDNIKYVESKDKGLVFSKQSLKIRENGGVNSWDQAFSSHRFTESSVLTYSIPVPDGKFDVRLLFAETYFSSNGKRVFNLFINGREVKTKLDVFKESGKNIGLSLDYRDISSVRGKLDISLIKVVENPMISGIIITGEGAQRFARSGSCKETNIDEDPLGQNNGYNHRAHAVPGGPYIATDFSKVGMVSVTLDGTQSHSHYSDPGPPAVTGKIVSYKWSWKEVANSSILKRFNSHNSGIFTALFPLGKTVVQLEVVDNTGDVAVDKTVVEVKVSTENGAYCYFYKLKNVESQMKQTGTDVLSKEKPSFGKQFGTIDFVGRSKLSSIAFSKDPLLIKCVFYLHIVDKESKYTVLHNGLFKFIQGNRILKEANSKGSTTTKLSNLNAGFHQFELLYYVERASWPLLSFRENDKIITSPKLRYDLANIIPTIHKISRSTSSPSGGENIQIYGSGFINHVSVSFGQTKADNLISSNTGMLQVTVPPGKGNSYITVNTKVGSSNQFAFTYTTEGTLNQPVVFEKSFLKTSDGEIFKVSFIASIMYGPDGRLYLGGTKGKIYALDVNTNLQVDGVCERSMKRHRAVLGIAFNPSSVSLKMYFSTSTMYWKDFKILDFEDGWTNGKIQSITWSPDITVDDKSKNEYCAGPITDVIVGLPVSNHDHGVNKLLFLANGDLLISIGGFTNGGVSTPGKKPIPGDAEDDAMGGVGDSTFSSALVSCPVNKFIKITYDNYEDPESSKIISSSGCKLFATGVRNSFGMTLHTNDQIYLTDNGPNAGFGDFSIDCEGGRKKAKNLPDRLYRVTNGSFLGHPNLNRKECQHYPSTALQPLISNIKSSSSGIFEYRSNTFGGKIKGNLFISMFAAQGDGRVSEVRLSKDGKTVTGFAPNFLDFSGVAVEEGPRGEIIMARVYKDFVIVARPTYNKPQVTFLIGVHPKNGPYHGGSRVLLSGHNFGKNPSAIFGDKACTEVIVISDESFSCLSPSNHKNTKVSVKVTGSSGKSAAYGVDYWYW